MIANCKPISHGKAAAEYDENKRIEGEHVAHEVMRQDVFGLDGAEIVKEMQECQASSKHRLKNAYFRIEIVPSHEEEAATWTDEQWQDVINEYSQRMGIQNAQAYWVLHRRTDHDKELPHVHGLVNRIDKDGNVLSDKFCQKRSIDVITQMTKKRGYKTADEVSKDLRTTIKETATLAFTFQAKDLELLGLTATDDNAEDLKTLDLFWNCYEIMGVSLVDIGIWKWMYEHPDATADQVKTAMIDIAKQVWNKYYAPVFKCENEPILAIYSHAIIDPLYLSAYPIGHIIDFQLESYLKGKNMADEVTRIYRQGRLEPNLWMERAVGEKISVHSLIHRTEQAVKNVSGKRNRSF